jgi:hypothetical protein
MKIQKCFANIFICMKMTCHYFIDFMSTITEEQPKTAMVQYLTTANQFSFDNVTRIGEMLRSEVFSSDASFEGYLSPHRSDFDMNPIEDFIIVKLYLDHELVPRIADLISRSIRSVNLRLRLLLHPLEVLIQYRDGNERDEDAIKAVTYYLKARSDSFIAFSKQRDVERDLSIQREFVEMMNESVFS